MFDDHAFMGIDPYREIYDLSKGGIKKQACSLLENGSTLEEGRYEPYACPNCYHLTVEFYFRLRKGNDEYEPDYQCSHCDAFLKRIQFAAAWSIYMYEGKDEYTKKYQKYQCPQCGSDKMCWVPGMFYYTGEVREENAAFEQWKMNCLRKQDET
ncbi:MAG: hypothetical protein LBQ20_08375 [Rhodanobacter sp.]|jgi:ribosomal protein L37AE/L43A|nr:hypothetical protein [Rhodanobacter sp.]